MWSKICVFTDWIKKSCCRNFNLRFFFQSGDSVKINLDGISDESSTDNETVDYSVGFGSPPSPCNVLFEGDNVLINGKSNLLKQPKQQKVRIDIYFQYPLFVWVAAVH